MQKTLLFGAVGILALGGAVLFLGSQDSLFKGGPAGSSNGVGPAEEIVPAADYVVEISDAGFLPETLEIRLGETVAWVNRGEGYYWPASNIHPTHEIYPEFDPREPLAPGEAWAFTFEQAGEWRCHDHLGPSRNCTIRVSE
ncbi:MAG: hypothetical protein Q8P12_04365 [bacterium]|nr:hypothetical protein [bacterium]